MSMGAGELKVLVVIASYGEKNLAHLQRIISTYQSMNLHVDLIITSEAPKSVNLGVRVVVGTPTRNPRSLPFAHKQLFAESVGRYDVYIYTEDDIHVREEGIRAFLEVNSVVQPDEIPGFVRYEVAPDGTRYVPDAHGTFHWKPASVRRRGPFLIAEYTNEHSGFYMLTDAQLRKAVDKGSFVCQPYEGRYEMLESAATDIYVKYGFRKVICVSHLERFLVHHMPNRYVGQMGILLSLFEEQIRALDEIHAGSRPAATLCEVEPKILPIRCGKTYDECPSPELLRAVPMAAKSILSIGSGSGATERALQARGARLTLFPLDSIVGALSSREGFEVVNGSIDECLHAVRDRRFDCVVMTNLFHLLADPESVLARAASLVAPSGTLVLLGRNFDHLPTLIKRLVGAGEYGRIRNFAESGMRPGGPRIVDTIMSRVGFEVNAVTWGDRGWPAPLDNLARRSGRLGARTWIVQAQRRFGPERVELSRSSEVAQV